MDKLIAPIISALQAVFLFFMHQNNLRKALIPHKGALKRVHEKRVLKRITAYFPFTGVREMKEMLIAICEKMK